MLRNNQFFTKSIIGCCIAEVRKCGESTKKLFPTCLPAGRDFSLGCSYRPFFSSPNFFIQPSTIGQGRPGESFLRGSSTGIILFYHLSKGRFPFDIVRSVFQSPSPQIFFLERWTFWSWSRKEKERLQHLHQNWTYRYEALALTGPMRTLTRRQLLTSWPWGLAWADRQSGTRLLQKA